MLIPICFDCHATLSPGESIRCIRCAIEREAEASRDARRSGARYTCPCGAGCVDRGGLCDACEAADDHRFWVQFRAGTPRREAARPASTTWL